MSAKILPFKTREQKRFEDEVEEAKRILNLNGGIYPFAKQQYQKDYEDLQERIDKKNRKVLIVSFVVGGILLVAGLVVACAADA